MKCGRCQEKLDYGAKYCNVCGEKVPKGAYDADYNATVWAKFDKVKEGYDKLLLKKITGSIIFKTVIMIVVLGYFFFTLYGNFMGIRLQDSDAYTIAYNKEADEYYITPEKDESKLELYIPVFTNSVVFTEVTGENKNVIAYSIEEYEENGYSVSVGEKDYVLIEARKDDKVIDTIKVVAIN